LFPIVGNKIARRAGELLKVDGKPKMTGRDGLQMRECICQRAPFRVQDVEHVVVTPFWHLMHAATHCLKSFASSDGKRSLSHLLVLPVTSLAGEHGLPVEFTLDACRHGGMTELEEAELTDGQGRALSAHRTKESYAGYAKRTEARMLSATRKRHAHALANQLATSVQNATGDGVQNENAENVRSA
jgi:hypothetical protein